MPEPIVQDPPKDAPATWIDTLPDEVKTGIPEDFRKDPEISKYKTIQDFLKGVQEKTALIGRKGVILPTEKSTPEEREAFFNAIGRPEKPEGYKFTDIKDLHPSLKVTPESQKQFAEFLHKNGVPNSQADAFNQYATKYLSDMLTNADKAYKESQEKAINDLKAAWGDKFEENITGAKTLVEKVGGADALGAFGELGNNPKVLAFLHKLSTVISEDSISKITTSGGAQMPEQEAAAKEIQDIIADAKGAKAHPMNDPKHPDHNKWGGIDGLWTQLNKKAYKQTA